MTTRTYFVTWWHMLTASGQFRKYSRIFEGENLQECEELAKAHALKKQKITRVYSTDVLKFHVETLRPYYVDEQGVGHLPSERVECTRVASYTKQ